MAAASLFVSVSPRRSLLFSGRDLGMARLWIPTQTERK
jgi:hypothetical protein